VRIDNDAFTGTPLPPEEPTGDNPPDGALLDYYLPSAASKVELSVYDSQHSLVRHMGSEAAKEAAHAPLPIAARWFPKPQRLATGAGMHRIAWTLGWNTSDDVAENEPDDGEGDVPRPPRVPPGAYTVDLQVEGERVSTVPLVLLKDPRSDASGEQLAEQFATGVRIFSDSLACRRALAEIAALRERLAQSLAAPGGGGHRSAPSTKKLQEQLDDLVEGSTGLETVNMELTSSLNVVESSDRPAPAQALAVYDLARAALQPKLERWTKLKEGPLAKLDRQWQSRGIAPLGVRDIEREVDYLLTR
jgi:hypothetical protein